MINNDNDIEDLFVTVPTTIKDVVANLHGVIAYLCRSKCDNDDLLELCRGAGNTSQVAFRRGMTSGDSLDLITGCDLGDPMTQKAINHYLDVCYVMVTVLQPICRSVMNYNTWNKHYQEDLPHLQYCGQVALKQMKMGRYFIREQLAGVQLDHIDCL